VDNLTVDLQSPKIMGHWEEIMSRINSGDMPPEDEARPKPEEISKVADWILLQLREAETVRQSSVGERVAFRKLTRDEYGNTVRDLLGVDFDVKLAAAICIASEHAHNGGPLFGRAHCVNHRPLPGTGLEHPGTRTARLCRHRR
jgi:hypothetical protein